MASVSEAAYLLFNYCVLSVLMQLKNILMLYVYDMMLGLHDNVQLSRNIIEYRWKCFCL